MTANDSGALLRRAIMWMLVPGLVIATAYVYGLRAGALREIASARTSLESARRDMPAVAEVARTLNEVEALRDRVTSEREGVEGARSRASVGAGRARPTDPEVRARASERLSSVLARRGIALLEESSGFDSNERVPEALAQRLTGSRAPLSPRTLRLRARYMDLLDALSELVEPDVGVVPLELRLTRERDASGVSLWTLVVI